MYTQSQLKDLVEKTLLNITFPEDISKLYDPVKYVLSAGGKRIRPVITLMACNLFSDKIDNAVLPSAGLEIFHNFTLVHDDIMDNSMVRRNLPTVHTKWNLNQAILSGDVMVFIANECFFHLPPDMFYAVLRIYNKSAIDVCTGQQLDMDFEKILTVSEKEYLHMIELKTAALIAGCAKIGALLGGAETKDRDIMYEFGKNLGMAFQIQDDLLDVYGDTKMFGKTTGSDITANKKTYLYVKSMELASGKILKTFQTLFQNKESDSHEKIKKVIDIYDTLHVKSITEELAKNYISAAITNLENIAVGADRKYEIKTIVESLSGRNI
ncbi:MAG TPA: polyprenyl synthetase family protein [Bacteroidales bacterium]|mgnify:CR=1 FL=1|nr:polyprenyl synthetase family protein [Bacteroidales bacterium]HQJ21582.1 polyprenyl synthetase family protein [Bacteroidales bacterium]